MIIINFYKPIEICGVYQSVEYAHTMLFSFFFLLSFIFLSFLSTTSSSSSDGSEFYSYSRPCVTNTTHNIQYINQSIHRFNEKLQAFNMLLSVFDFFFIIFSLQFIALIRFFFLPFHFVSLASNQTLFNNRQHTHTQYGKIATDH